MIKILMADDHPIVREGLRQILSVQPDIDVSGEAETCKEVLKKMSEDHYDLLLLDINMPDRMGLDIIDEIRTDYPACPVLILSTYPEEQYAISALKSGASGYLVKKSAPKELIKAIQKVSSGEKYVSSSLAQRMAEYLACGGEMMPHEKLSSRESQVMHMLASGKSVTEIADELILSVNTVSTYRSRVLEKMNMKKNVELITYAIKHQLI